MIGRLQNLFASPLTLATLRLGGDLLGKDGHERPLPQYFRSQYYLGRPGLPSQARALLSFAHEVAARAPRVLTQPCTLSRRLEYHQAIDDVTNEKIRNLFLSEKQLSTLVNLQECYSVEEFQTLVDQLDQSDYVLYGTRIIDLFFDLFDGIETSRIIKDLRKTISNVLRYKDSPSEFLFQFISLHFLAVLSGEFSNLKAERSIVEGNICIRPDLYDDKTKTAVEIKCIRVLSRDIHRKSGKTKPGSRVEGNGIQSSKYNDWLTKNRKAKLRYIIIGEPNTRIIAGMLEGYSEENRHRISIHFYTPWDLQQPYSRINHYKTPAKLDYTHNQFAKAYSDLAKQRVYTCLNHFDRNTLDSKTVSAFNPQYLMDTINASNDFMTVYMPEMLVKLYQPILSELKLRCESFAFDNLLDEFWPNLQQQLSSWRMAMNTYFFTPQFNTFANLVDQTINLKQALDNLELGALAPARLLPKNTEASLDHDKTRNALIKIALLNQSQRITLPCGDAAVTMSLKAGAHNGTFLLDTEGVYVTSNGKTTPATLEVWETLQPTSGFIVYKLTDANGDTSLVLLTAAGLHINTSLDPHDTEAVLAWAKQKTGADIKKRDLEATRWLRPQHISAPVLSQEIQGGIEIYETTLTYPDKTQLRFSTSKVQNAMNLCEVAYKGPDDEDFEVLVAKDHYMINAGYERGYHSLVFGVALQGLIKVAKPQFSFFIDAIFVMHRGAVLALAHKRWSRAELRKKFDELERQRKI